MNRSQCLFSISMNSFSKPSTRINSRNDTMNNLSMMNEMKLRNKMNQAQKSKKKQIADNAVMPSLPRTISEAQSIVDQYLLHNELLLMSDHQCPFCMNTHVFLDHLQLKYETIFLDSFGNRQLIQNYMQQLCENREQARFAPVLFVRNAEQTKGLFMVGADGIANAWQTGKLHEYYPHLLSPDNEHESYVNGTWDIEQWRKSTILLQSMLPSFGYKPANMSAHTKSSEPTAKQVNDWMQYLGSPILTKEIGANPQRPE